MTMKAIRMPKWGLAMEEGAIVEWIAQEGDEISEGDELMDIETTKITNVLEATNSGRLARIVADAGEVMPVGALIGVLAEGEVAEADIDAFIAASPATVVEDDDEAEGDALIVEAIEASGYRLNVATAGSGRALVLIHGFSGDFNNWLFAIEELKARARVIAPDLPGHGASSKKLSDGSLADLSGAIAAMLNDLGVTDAVVAGHSLGAAVAMRLALDHPALVARLALICPAGLPGGTVNDSFLSAIVEAEKVRDVREALRLLVQDPETISRDMVDGVTRTIRLDGAQAALGQIRAGMLQGSDFANLQSRLDDLPGVTVIASHNDAIVGAPDIDALPADWTVHWIDSAGHLPHLEAAAEVNALLRDLL